MSDTEEIAVLKDRLDRAQKSWIALRRYVLGIHMSTVLSEHVPKLDVALLTPIQDARGASVTILDRMAAMYLCSWNGFGDKKDPESVEAWAKWANSYGSPNRWRENALKDHTELVNLLTEVALEAACITSRGR